MVYTKFLPSQPYSHAVPRAVFIQLRGKFFVVGFIYTDRVAGEKVKGQAQSMIVMFTYGIGMLLGSQISGALYNHLVAGQSVPKAWVTFWWIPAVAAAVIALIFLFSFQYNEKEPH